MPKGRTAGAGSYANIPLCDLVKMFGAESTINVVVRRRWAEFFNLETTATTGNVASTTVSKPETVTISKPVQQVAPVGVSVITKL
jgi:hypothetical protein